MEGRAKRAAGLKTREVILEAARELFLRQGYHATGVREIAHSTGISLSAVYNHFSSKEEIFKALLAEHNLYRIMVAGLNRAQGNTVVELLESGFIEIMEALQGQQDFVLLVFIDVLEFQARHVAELAVEMVPQILGFFQRVSQVGQENGELRDVHPALVARTYMGMVLSSFIIEHVLRMMPLPLRVENWQRGMIDILAHGVVKGTPGAEGG